MSSQQNNFCEAEVTGNYDYGLILLFDRQIVRKSSEIFYVSVFTVDAAGRAPSVSRPGLRKPVLRYKKGRIVACLGNDFCVF